MEKKGHYCYGCEEYFHDSNSDVREHKDCKGRKEFGICVDKKEFGEFYVGNLAEKNKQDLVEMVLKFKSTSLKLKNRIEDLKKELSVLEKEKGRGENLTSNEIEDYNFKETEIKKVLTELENLV